MTKYLDGGQWQAKRFADAHEDFGLTDSEMMRTMHPDYRNGQSLYQNKMMDLHNNEQGRQISNWSTSEEQLSNMIRAKIQRRELIILVR